METTELTILPKKKAESNGINVFANKGSKAAKGLTNLSAILSIHTSITPISGRVEPQ